MKKVMVFGTSALGVNVIQQLRKNGHHVTVIGDGQSSHWKQKPDIEFDLVAKSKIRSLEVFDETLTCLIKKIGKVDVVIYTPQYICNNTDLKLGDTIASSTLEHTLRLWVTYPRHLVSAYYRAFKEVNFFMLSEVSKQDSVLWTLKTDSLQLLSILATDKPEVSIRAHLVNFSELVAQARAITDSEDVNDQELKEYMLDEEARKVLANLQ